MKRIVLSAIFFMASYAVTVAQSLTILCENDPPLQFVENDGKISGMTVEIVREIQKRIGNTDPIQMVPWARGYEQIQKEPNVVLFSMTRTLERNPLFYWVGPVNESIYSFYAKADIKLVIRSLEEAKTIKSIGVYAEDVREQYLLKHGFKNLIRSNDNINNFKNVMAGRLEVYVSSINSFEGEAAAAGYKPSDIKILFSFWRAQLYIAMSINTPSSTLKSWTDAFDTMRKDGTFKTIFNKYYPRRDLPGPVIIPD